MVVDISLKVKNIKKKRPTTAVVGPRKERTGLARKIVAAATQAHTHDTPRRLRWRRYPYHRVANNGTARIRVNVSNLLIKVKPKNATSLNLFRKLLIKKAPLAGFGEIAIL